MTATAKTVAACRGILGKLENKQYSQIKRIISNTAKYNSAELIWNETGEDTFDKGQHVTSAQMRYLMVHRLIEIELTVNYYEYFGITEQGRAAIEEARNNQHGKTE